MYYHYEFVLFFSDFMLLIVYSFYYLPARP